MPAKGPTSLGVPSELSALGPDWRFGMPVEIRRALPWLEGTGTVRLIAELVTPGRIRLFLKSDISPQIEAARRVLGDKPGDGEALAAFDDRWRPVVFYGSNGSVVLGEIVAVFLLSDPQEAETIFIEARRAFVSVMTLAVRNARLQTYARQTQLAEPDDNTGLDAQVS